MGAVFEGIYRQDVGGEVDLRINIYRGQIEVIRRNPEMTHKALGEELSVSAATIKRTLAKLQQENKVVREGSNRKGKWILTDT